MSKAEFDRTVAALTNLANIDDEDGAISVEILNRCVNVGLSPESVQEAFLDVLADDEMFEEPFDRREIVDVQQYLQGVNRIGYQLETFEKDLGRKMTSKELDRLTDRLDYAAQHGHVMEVWDAAAELGIKSRDEMTEGEMLKWQVARAEDESERVDATRAVQGESDFQKNRPDVDLSTMQGEWAMAEYMAERMQPSGDTEQEQEAA